MSDRQDVIEFILDHYENPRNHGPLRPADVVMKGGNPACGDVVTLFLRVDPVSQCIEEISFTGEGCTISQASASLTTTRVKGQALAYLRTVRAPELLEEMGESVLRNRRRCATLALHTLRAALTHYLQDHPELAPLASEEDRESGLRFERQPDTEG